MSVTVRVFRQTDPCCPFTVEPRSPVVLGGGQLTVTDFSLTGDFQERVLYGRVQVGVNVQFIQVITATLKLSQHKLLREK